MSKEEINYNPKKGYSSKNVAFIYSVIATPQRTVVKLGGNGIYVYYGGLTSAIQASSTGHRERIDSNAKTYGKNKQWEGYGNIITTNCTTLDTLLQQIGVTHVDYFSLDVEGGELFVLESIDWNAMEVDIFTIETQEHRTEIIDLMKSHGYQHIEPSPLPFDDVFVRAAAKLPPHTTAARGLLLQQQQQVQR